MPLLIRRGPDCFDLVRCQSQPAAVLLATLTRAQVVHLGQQCVEVLFLPDDPPAQPQGDGTAGDIDPGDCDEPVLVDSDDESA